MIPPDTGVARPHSLRSPEDGFSIVEVVVGMVVMLVAVLGTLTLIQGALASTTGTKAREQGTSLARDLVERSRQLPYADMSTGAAPASLRDALPASDATAAVDGGSFTVRRRGTTYTVAVSACTIDDPTDGPGAGDLDSFCRAAGAGGDPATTVPPPAAGGGDPATTVSVLGVRVALAGSLLETVCGAVGTPAILEQLTGAVSALAPVSVCPNGSGSGGTANFDSQPDDLRRVRIDVTWRGNRAESIAQTTLLTNPTP